MKLAINGGTPIRTVPFPNQANIGMEEMRAAERVLKTQMLSGYRGNAQKYRGGVEVQAFESEFSKKFGIEHSIAINSCTSALHVACLAIGLKPGDEVIVTPYSMTCSATAPMICGATPVFADVESDYFCLDPEDVERKITDKTKAIIAVNLFGQPFGPVIRDLANAYNLYLIEDAAQALGSYYKTDGAGEGIKEVRYKLDPDDENSEEFVEYRRHTGSIGHISCFSFTQGKHITAGEGGMITTSGEILAMKCRLLMNHAEAVINDFEIGEFANIPKSMWGLNLRMTEIQAAILREQLKKLDWFIGKRQENAAYLSEPLESIPPITAGKVRENCTHSFYVQPFLWNQEAAEGIHRDKFINAVKAELSPMAGREEEGVRMGNGYIKPLYRMPIFKHKRDMEDPNEVARAMLFQHKVKTEDEAFKMMSYEYQFPNVEKLWKDELFLHLYLAPPTARVDLDDIIMAFNKVWENRDELRK